MQKYLKQLVFNKNGEKYIFRYEQGSEDKLLDVLVEQAKDPQTNFDWFDASVLSFKLTEKLLSEADKMVYKDSPQHGSLLG